jgi:hypothetical protein
MTIYHGIYSWDGTKTDSNEPIAWFGGSYSVRIFRRALGSDKVEHLRPYICIFSGTGCGQSISANPEKFAKRICNDFQLDLERVLWVEEAKLGRDRYEIIHFTRSMTMGKTVFYQTEKRAASTIEIKMLERELALQDSSMPDLVQGGRGTGE